MAEKKGEGHLYTEEEREDFRRRYGKRGDEVFGETLGKVAREQAAARPGGVKVEHVEGHVAFSDRGPGFRVRGHEAFVHAHPHGRDHHAPPCGPGCRHAMRSHKHRRGRGSSRRG